MLNYSEMQSTIHTSDDVLDSLT